MSIELLSLEELPRREALMTTYGIGRGEAACLVLALRDTFTAVFLSSDEDACTAAQALSISYLTIPDILTSWVRQARPSRNMLQEFVDGMRNASFGLTESFYQQLQAIISEPG